MHPPHTIPLQRALGGISPAQLIPLQDFFWELLISFSFSAHEAGTTPRRLFRYRMILERVETFDHAEGKVPERVLLLAMNQLSFAHALHSLGKVPCKRLSLTSIVKIFLKFFHSGGSVPTIWLLPNPRYPSLLM